MKHDFILIAITVLTLFSACARRPEEVAKLRSDEVAKLQINMVSIPGKNFSICKYEVTQALWESVMGGNPSEFKGADLPVEHISLFDCYEFLKRLNALPDVKKSGVVYRLPNADEWEYACRAGSTGFYGLLADGKEGSPDEMGWHKDNSGGKTHPVGQKKPNAFGLYDMHGNVEEWTSSFESRGGIVWGGDYCNDSAFSACSGLSTMSAPDACHSGLGFRLASGETVEAETQFEVVPLETEAEAGVRRTAEYEAAVRAAISKLPGSMVAIPGRDYSICKYEVTQALWESVMGWNHSHFEGADLPVERVSWFGCQEFLRRLNAMPEVKKSGIVYRLPTVDEWEYACRAGSTGKYGLLADGNVGTLDEMGWYEDNSGDKTHPVGQKKANAFGLYDMHGNVEEWTSTAGRRSCRVYCGGSYSSDRERCGSGNRDRYSPASVSSGLGFRLAGWTVKAEKAKQAAVRQAISSLASDMVPIPETDYSICKYEVAQALWEAVMWDNPSEFMGANQPVECVSWYDCQEFLKKLNAMPEVVKSGVVYRLPTRFEWQYACLAGSAGKYGLLADGTEGTLDEMGWYEDNSGDKTHPIGQKKPNAFGLYDMHGNVWEWTSTGSDHGKLTCGGSWDNGAWCCEWDFCLRRDHSDPDYCDSHLGFRLACDRTAKEGE